MNLIPASWKIQWDVWQVQMLVLLSLTLQIILFVFGKRRKNISSQCINVIVWLAYTMADWVATVALGKLSRTLNNIPNPNNELKALWAPLLLLHLGGPDTITAYSLNDNQLWIRHFLGMGVRATVAIYVIVMSWRYFWFSFMLIPAFVAGIIKYGERTWALKLACFDESKNIVPFYGGIEVPVRLASRSRCEIVLIMAHNLVMESEDYTENYDIRRSIFKVKNLHVYTYFENVLEVAMGLMYDLLYTKAPITFTKRGCIFRSISFMCTVSVLVGLFRLIAMEVKWHEQHYSMVDIVITGVLLVGALALEIYAVILLLFSDWAMIWLIKCGRGKWAIRLWQKFPWFFEKKKWSKKMGQIDLLKKEDKHEKWSRILGRLEIQEKFYRYINEQVTGGRMFPMDLRRIEELAVTRDEEGRKMEKIEETSVLLSVIFSDLVDEGNNEVKWEKLKNVWLAMLCYAAINGPKTYHLQQLTEGGELLNLVWFLIPQSYPFYGVDTFTLTRFFNKYFRSMPLV